MILTTNKSLKNHHTFGIDVYAENFIELESNEDIKNFAFKYLQFKTPIYIIGEGSNTLFTKKFEGTIAHVNNKGFEIIKEDSEYIYVSVQAGELWDDFINYCVKNDFYGAENLVAIPGTVGAAPVQNIGAYGVEAKDIISEVHCYELGTGKDLILKNIECEFEYRNSVFKTTLKDKYIVHKVIFKLSKSKAINVNYGSINDEIIKRNIVNPKAADIANVIRDIRNSKLPDVKKTGNAGSFFKNPIVCKQHFEALKTKFPNIVSYKVDDEHTKIAAGWLIENAGLKGYQIGGAAVHDKQTLVIININKASGEDVLKLSAFIQKRIFDMYKIELFPEVIFI